MAPRPWATEDQLVFLNRQYERFLDHQKRQVPGRFWPTLEHKWFALFSERTALFGNSADVLTAVQETSLGEAIKACKLQLQRWFRNKAAQQGRRVQVARTSWEILSSSLSAKNHRRAQPVEVYSRKYYNSKVKAAVQAEIASRSLGKKETLDVIKRLTKEAFENESDEVKMEIQQEVEALKPAVPDKESDEFPAVPMPTQHQTVIDNTPAMLNAFFTELERQTGWAFTVLGGGPSPIEGSAIRTLSFHQGITAAGHNFGQAMPDYTAHVARPFLEFIKVIYPADVRGSYALTPVTRPGSTTPEPTLESATGDSGKTSPSPGVAVPSSSSQADLSTTTTSDPPIDLANKMDSQSRHISGPASQSLTNSPSSAMPLPSLPSALDCSDLNGTGASSSGEAAMCSPPGEAAIRSSPPIPTMLSVQSEVGLVSSTLAPTLPSTLHPSRRVESPAPLVNTSSGFSQPEADAAIGLLDLLNGIDDVDLHPQTWAALTNVTNETLAAELEPQSFDFSGLSADFLSALQFPSPNSIPGVSWQDSIGVMYSDAAPNIASTSLAAQAGAPALQSFPVAASIPNVGLHSIPPSSPLYTAPHPKQIAPSTISVTTLSQLPLNARPHAASTTANNILSTASPCDAPGSTSSPSVTDSPDVIIPTIAAVSINAETVHEPCAHDNTSTAAPIGATRGRSPSRGEVPTALQQCRPALGMHHPPIAAASVYVARPARECRALRRPDASPQRLSTSVPQIAQMPMATARVMPISKAQQEVLAGKENVPPASTPSAKKRAAASQGGPKKSKRGRKY